MSSLSESDGERYGRFPSVLSVKTPLGMREQLRAAAAIEKISVGEFVRRTLGEALGVTILRPAWSSNSPGLRRRSTIRGRISSKRQCGP